MAASLKAVSRSWKEKETVRKGPTKGASPAPKAGKRPRLPVPSVGDWLKSAMNDDAYTQSKWADLQEKAWTENDDMACLMDVERTTIERGMKALDGMTWGRMLLLRQSVTQRNGHELFLGDLDDNDPELLLAAVGLLTLRKLMAERFPEQEKKLQALKY